MAKPGSEGDKPVNNEPGNPGVMPEPGAHNTEGVLCDGCQDTHAEFTSRLYRAGRTLLVRVPKTCAEIEGVCPGDTIRVTIKRETRQGARP